MRNLLLILFALVFVMTIEIHHDRNLAPGERPFFHDWFEPSSAHMFQGLSYRPIFVRIEDLSGNNILSHRFFETKQDCEYFREWYEKNKWNHNTKVGNCYEVQGAWGPYDE